MIKGRLTPGAFYDALASNYDLMTDAADRLVRERPFFRMLVERFRITRALDAGCGTGIHAILLGMLGVNVTAVDVSEEMVSQTSANARRLGVPVEAICAELGDLSRVPGFGSFNAIFCMGNTLAHVLDVRSLDRVLAGFRRLLVPGGVLIVQLLNTHGIARDRETVLNERERGGKSFRRLYRPRDPHLEFHTIIADAASGQQNDKFVLHHPWSPEELRQAVETARFEDIQLYGGIELQEFVPATSRDIVVLARVLT